MNIRRRACELEYLYSSYFFADYGYEYDHNCASVSSAGVGLGGDTGAGGVDGGGSRRTEVVSNYDYDCEVQTHL